MIISLECFGSGLIGFEHEKEFNKKTNKIETIDHMKFNEKIARVKTIQKTEFKYVFEAYNEQNKIICKIYYFSMKEFKIIINNNYLKIVEFKKD